MDAYHSFRIKLATADVAFAQAVDGAAAGFTEAEDAAQAGHDKQVADALETEQQTFDADQVTYQTALAEARRWARAQQADADLARSKAYDLAQKNFGVAAAKAAQTEADAVAAAAQTRDNAIADALETQQTADAQALATAGQTFAAAQGSPTTPWGTES